MLWVQCEAAAAALCAAAREGKGLGREGAQGGRCGGGRTEAGASHRPV
jgi:hypothetical protein